MCSRHGLKSVKMCRKYVPRDAESKPGSFMMPKGAMGVRNASENAGNIINEMSCHMNLF